MPDDPKKPPALPPKKSPVKAKGDIHEGAEALQKKIARGYRADHPALSPKAREAFEKGTK